MSWKYDVENILSCILKHLELVCVDMCVYARIRVYVYVCV